MKVPSTRAKIKNIYVTFYRVRKRGSRLSAMQHMLRRRSADCQQFGHGQNGKQQFEKSASLGFRAL